MGVLLQGAGHLARAAVGVLRDRAVLPAAVIVLVLRGIAGLLARVAVGVLLFGALQGDRRVALLAVGVLGRRVVADQLGAVAPRVAVVGVGVALGGHPADQGPHRLDLIAVFAVHVFGSRTGQFGFHRRRKGAHGQEGDDQSQSQRPNTYALDNGFQEYLPFFAFTDAKYPVTERA